MPDQKASPTVVIFVTPGGVREVQVHSPGRKAEAEGHALYSRLRALVDKLDRAARVGVEAPEKAERMTDIVRSGQPKRPG